jgi:hypothetical protein
VAPVDTRIAHKDVKGFCSQAEVRANQ